jgi:hypothetical protein
VIYPNGKVLSFGYGAARGLDAVLEGAKTLERLLFLGLDTVVDRSGRIVLFGWRKADGGCAHPIRHGQYPGSGGMHLLPS